MPRSWLRAKKPLNGFQVLAVRTTTLAVKKEDRNSQTELYLGATTAKWHTKCTREFAADYLAVNVINANMSVVIKSEFDTFTKDELFNHAKLVNEAKLDELKRWHSLNCFRRMPRKKATNNVDGTWVLKWKKVRK